MDIVYIRDLRVDALIGIYDWERSVRQVVRIDVEMGWDNRKPATSDNIVDTLNYKEAAQRIKQRVQETEYQLVETLAERLVEMLIHEMHIPWVKLRLGKPYAVKDSSEVGVCIERHQSDFKTG
jgi:dihydroneopterin aldolase